MSERRKCVVRSAISGHDIRGRARVFITWASPSVTQQSVQKEALYADQIHASHSTTQRSTAQGSGWNGYRGDGVDELCGFSAQPALKVI